ncbi:MAG: acyl-ACP--UDP-N-acetylglucosamine O-acyltransferase [Bdellovibrionales bacterium]|nr:acyl-ACP--UDP-N-acetylglucosamine O-acyltransferase [Bdellovibrionales bacterium]
MSVHPSSIIGPKVKLGANVSVGPFVSILGDVTIGDGTQVGSNAVIGDEKTKVVIGKNNIIAPGAIIGGPPQDLTYKGEKTELIIGDNNTIREFVTINVGTPKGGGVTRVGNNNLLMAYVHVAHDCQIGSHVVIANSCQFAGHVHVEDHVKIGGLCVFNQFVVIGQHSYITGDSAVNKDVPPFVIAQGKYAIVRAANEIGMARAGIEKPEIESVRRAVRVITKGGHTLAESLERIDKEFEKTKTLIAFIDFIKSDSRKRGLALA